MPRPFPNRFLQGCYGLSWMASVLILLCVGMDGASAQPSLRDPTRPEHYIARKGHAVDRKQHQWQLESILYGPDRRVAVIDGHAVSRGERVYGARVISIRPTQVILEYKGRRHTLHWRRLVQVKQQ